CAFSPAGRLLATAGQHSVIRIWNGTNGLGQGKLDGGQGRVTALAFSPADESLASAGEDGSVCLWAGNENRPAHTLRAGTNCLMAIAFSHDGKWLAAAEGAVSTGYGNPLTLYAPSSTSGRVFVWKEAE